MNKSEQTRIRLEKMQQQLAKNAAARLAKKEAKKAENPYTA